MRNLATVGLKLLGILGLYWATTEIAQIIFFLAAAISGAHTFFHDVWGSWLIWLLSTLITVAFSVTLLVRTGWIVTKLNFPEDPPSSGMRPSQLLRVGFVLVGTFIIIGALPDIGSTVYSVSTFNPGMSRSSVPNIGPVIPPAMKFILGCIVLGKADRFARSVFSDA